LTLLWVGVDAGKEHHHAAAVDEFGRVQWSTRIPNDQTAIGELLSRAADHDVTWGIDLVGCETALLRAMLAVAQQTTVYVPGRTVKTMAAGFAGEAKTDARDAVVIANTIRMRHDFQTVTPATDLVAHLELLLAHRSDVIDAWVRNISKLRRLMLRISPAMERALTFTNVSTLILLTGFQTPAQIRAAGRDELLAHLDRHRALHVAKTADTALAAAARQDITLPGQDLAADLVAQVAADLLELRRRLNAIDKTIASTFDQHPQSKVILSLPGVGPLVAAEFHGRRRRPGQLPQLRPPRRLRWARPCTKRLRQTHQQPSTAPKVQPQASTGDSTCPHLPPSARTGPTAPTTSASAPKAGHTSKQSWP
jgi:hypothetical protein